MEQNSQFNEGFYNCELVVCLELSIRTSEHTGFVFFLNILLSVIAI